MSNEIKSEIMNSFVHPWQERLSCFDCKNKGNLLEAHVQTDKH